MRIKRQYIILLAILIFFPMFGVLLDRMLVYRTRKVEQRMQTFVSKVIDSVNDGTDFHKKYLDKGALSRIKPFISKSYEIVLIDVDFGLWEYNIIFDERYRLYISLLKENGDYSISVRQPTYIENNEE